MISPVCCIRDQLTGYMNPFVVVNENVAERDFKILINDPNNAMSYNPQHFDLYHLADFDSELGTISPIEPTIIVTGLSVVQGGKKHVQK